MSWFNRKPKEKVPTLSEALKEVPTMEQMAAAYVMRMGGQPTGDYATDIMLGAALELDRLEKNILYAIGEDMAKVKMTRTAKMTFNNCVNANDLRDFLAKIPEDAKITVKEPRDYPMESGVTPGYLEASWDEQS